MEFVETIHHVDISRGATFGSSKANHDINRNEINYNEFVDIYQYELLLIIYISEGVLFWQCFAKLSF